MGDTKSRAYLFLGLGFLSGALTFLLPRLIGVAPLSGPMRGIIYFMAGWATLCWVVGCINYARLKGYHPLVGLVGILQVFGLLLLFVLPDRKP